MYAKYSIDSQKNEEAHTAFNGGITINLQDVLES